MKLDLSAYSNLKICVAVSGGKDSMALLHYLYAHAEEYGISLSALNCDHKLRGDESARDSAVVKKYCIDLGIPCVFYEWNGEHGFDEQSARQWRLSCYRAAVKPEGERWKGADAIATAHHMNDNAETVLFNLARGSGLSGLCGIADYEAEGVKLIRPLIGCSRKDIDEYLRENGIPYVVDETNLTDNYTRNKIRHNVLPALENAVPGASDAIFRFSRLAAEDEEFFGSLIAERKLIKLTPFGAEIAFCGQKPLFKRAAIAALKSFGGVRDYTASHAESLYLLQFAEKGKKFEFLRFTAYKEEGKIVICDICREESCRPSYDFIIGKQDIFGGQPLKIVPESCVEEYGVYPVKTLTFDADKLPEAAVVRFMREGDRFTKFGGGTKNLGDYFTDLKIPVRMRKFIPLIAVDRDIYAVCGVEISDKIRTDAATKQIYKIICTDFCAVK